MIEVWLLLPSAIDDDDDFCSIAMCVNYDILQSYYESYSNNLLISTIIKIYLFLVLIHTCTYHNFACDIMLRFLQDMEINNQFRLTHEWCMD